MIIFLKGNSPKEMRLMGDAIRNTQISNHRGALLIDDDSKDAEAKPLIEKLINGAPLIQGVDLSSLPWKENPTIILIGDTGAAKLKELEAAAPGLTDYLGPVKVVTFE